MTAIAGARVAHAALGDGCRGRSGLPGTLATASYRCKRILRFQLVLREARRRARDETQSWVDELAASLGMRGRRRSGGSAASSRRCCGPWAPARG